MGIRTARQIVKRELRRMNEPREKGDTRTSPLEAHMESFIAKYRVGKGNQTRVFIVRDEKTREQLRENFPKLRGYVDIKELNEDPRRYDELLTCDLRSAYGWRVVLMSSYDIDVPSRLEFSGEVGDRALSSFVSFFEDSMKISMGTLGRGRRLSQPEKRYPRRTA